MYKHAVAPPSVSSRGHTVGTGNKSRSRGYLDIDAPSLCTNIRSLLHHLMDKYNAGFACGDGESSEGIPLRGARESCNAESVILITVNALVTLWQLSPVRARFGGRFVQLLSRNKLCETSDKLRPSNRHVCATIPAAIPTGSLLATNTRNTRLESSFTQS